MGFALKELSSLGDSHIDSEQRHNVIDGYGYIAKGVHFFVRGQDVGNFVGQGFYGRQSRIDRSRNFLSK